MNKTHLNSNSKTTVRSFRVGLITASALALSLSGCATNPATGQPGFVPFPNSRVASIFDNPNACSNNDRNIGVVVGGVAGLIAGHFIGKSPLGTVLGGAVGAGVGGLIGHEFDARRCALYKIAQANDIRLASAAITPRSLGVNGYGQPSHLGLDVQIPDGQNEFEPGTAMLTPHARTYLTQIAGTYVTPVPTPPGANPTEMAATAPSPINHKILIVGHSSGSSDSNPAKAALLSQQRAKAVAQVFADQGVPASNIYYQGAGNTSPIASDDTPDGQAQNRRIQIVDVPTRSDLKRYMSSRAPNPTFFRSAQPNVGTATAVKPTQNLNTSLAYNFGGAPVAGSGTPITLGRPVSHSMFSLITSANAGAPLIEGSCLDATPHIATPVRNFATGDQLPVRDYMPGFYGAPWTSRMNGNLVALLGVYVPRDTSLPIPKPDVQIYRGFSEGNKAISFSRHSTVNVYRGSQAVLYRVFVNGPAKCIDLVVPNGDTTANGHLYYPRGSSTYAADGKFKLQQGGRN